MKKILLGLLINSCFYNAVLFNDIDILTKNDKTLEIENSAYIKNIKEVSKNFFQDKKIIDILKKIVQEVDSHNGMVGFVFDNGSKADVVSGMIKILDENPYFINKLRSEICAVDDLSFFHITRNGKDSGFKMILFKSGMLRSIPFSFRFDPKSLKLTYIEFPVGLEKEGDDYVVHYKYSIKF